MHQMMPMLWMPMFTLIFTILIITINLIYFFTFHSPSITINNFKNLNWIWKW